MSQTPHFCQHCRTPLQPGLRFCEQCGQPVIASPPVRSRSNRGLLLGGVGVLLAVLCLMALVVAGLLLLFPIRREQAGPVSAPIAATVGDTPVAATVIPPTPALVKTPFVTPTSVTTPPVAAVVSNFVRLVEVKSPEQVTSGEMFGITITYAWSFNPEGTVGIRAEGGGATRDAPGRPTLVSGAGEASAGLGKIAPDQPGQHTFFVETYGILPDGSEIIDRRQVTVNVIAAPDTTATGGSADYVRITDVQMPPQIPTGVIFGVTVNYEWSFADQSELRLRGSFGNAADSFITKNVQGSGQDSIYLGKHALSELGPHTFTIDLYGMPPGGPELEDHRQVTIEATTLEALITPTPVALTAAPVFQPLSGAINLFFTIQPDGTPWGYIVDKQGREIYPETGIPAVSINAQPGDLVLIQTNTPVFSLLLDCGTSPQSYAPCDFIAATPAELPQEIWVNKDGGSAYVNISGPGNWGNPRPGFEPQRYPADPVFRFVLSR